MTIPRFLLALVDQVKPEDFDADVATALKGTGIEARRPRERRATVINRLTKPAASKLIDLLKNRQARPRAEGTPRYMVSLETHMDMDWVYAQELPDVMALLGQWMPTIQAAAISEVVRQFNDPHGQNRDVVDLLTQLTSKR